MKTLKILFLFLLFVITCFSVLGQNTEKNCRQKVSERLQLIEDADKNPNKVRSIQFDGNEFIRDKDFREKIMFNEGDLFSRKLLEKSIKNINKSFRIYPINLKNIWIRLDKSNKDVYLVFCVKEK